MQELISVIVPIYNVEKYLSKCLDSICTQTYRNLEIILIDDGSPDRCPEICDEYVKIDERIKVLHQENGGLSVARNSGLDIAKGNFICFVDPDDYLHPQMYECLYNNLKKYDADISICEFERVFENDKFFVSNNINESITICNGREALEKLYGEYRVTTTVAWNKLYKKELFQNIRYGKNKIHEDEFIVHRILDKAKKVLYTSYPFYYYLQRNTSIMGEKFNLKRLDVLEALEERILYFYEKGYDDLYEKAYNHYLGDLLYHYSLLRKYCPEEKVSKELKGKFSEVLKSRGDVKLPKIAKIKYDIFLLSPFLYSLVKNFWIFCFNPIIEWIYNSFKSHSRLKKWRPEN